MNRSILGTTILAMASAVVAPTASAAGANIAGLVLDEPMNHSSGGLALGAPSDPSATYYNRLEVKKTAETSFERLLKWKIEKTSDIKELYLDPGDYKSVEYKVTVSPNEYKDAKWAVSGEITISNPTYKTAKITAVQDVIRRPNEPDIGATVNCGVTYPHYLKPGEYLKCTYYADLPDEKERENTATVKTEGYVEGNTATANVIFGDPAKTVDDCVKVIDDTGETILGTVCSYEAPKYFKYSMQVGPYWKCGEHQFKNVASFVTKDTSATASAYHVVDIKVPCLYGCTRTQGYWKTHSKYGPAPYDSTWAQLPQGENTIFFKSNKSWYDVFWTPPKGDAYYILAHQYMAAKLNRLAMADTSIVRDVIKYAEEYFANAKPGETLTTAKRDEILAWAKILDEFNNGLMEVQHCGD